MGSFSALSPSISTLGVFPYLRVSSALACVILAKNISHSTAVVGWLKRLQQHTRASEQFWSAWTPLGACEWWPDLLRPGVVKLHISPRDLAHGWKDAEHLRSLRPHNEVDPFAGRLLHNANTPWVRRLWAERYIHQISMKFRHTRHAPGVQRCLQVLRACKNIELKYYNLKHNVILRLLYEKGARGPIVLPTCYDRTVVVLFHNEELAGSFCINSPEDVVDNFFWNNIWSNFSSTGWPNDLETISWREFLARNSVPSIDNWNWKLDWNWETIDRALPHYPLLEAYTISRPSLGLRWDFQLAFLCFTFQFQLQFPQLVSGVAERGKIEVNQCSCEWSWCECTALWRLKLLKHQDHLHFECDPICYFVELFLFRLFALYIASYCFVASLLLRCWMQLFN